MWWLLTATAPGLAADASTGSITGKISVDGPVWVYVDDERGPLPPSPRTEVMRQAGRAFEPSTLVVVRGSVVDFPNDGPDQHNVYWTTPQYEDDLGTYRTNETRQRVFDKPAQYPIGCYLHSEMSATILVVPNTWMTKAQADGRFEIAGVTPGTWKVTAWSPYAQTTVSKEVTVEAGKAARFEAAVR